MNENSLELFSLLSDTPQVSKEEMQNAYKHFTEQIIAISQSEQSYHEIFRKLNITRIEFDSLKSSSFYELKKKWAQKSISTESDDVAWIWNWFAEIYFLANKSLLQQQPIKYPQSLFYPQFSKRIGNWQYVRISRIVWTLRAIC